MTLPETALAFCRECLGWKHPIWLRSAKYIFEDGKPDEMYYNDLNGVMKTVQRWCIASGIKLIVMGMPGGEWGARLEGREGRITESSRELLCDALMDACVWHSRDVAGTALKKDDFEGLELRLT